MKRTDDMPLGHSIAHARRQPASRGGFTIIETLIVLAIAGLILLIIFEALPALSRSSQNNQRHQDVNAILQAVSNFELNHSANFPQAADNIFQNTKLTYYTSSEITLDGQASPGIKPTVGPVTNTNAVDVYNYELCSPTTTGVATTQGSDYTDVVALYALQTGPNSTAAECQQL